MMPRHGYQLGGMGNSANVALSGTIGLLPGFDLLSLMLVYVHVCMRACVCVCVCV